MPAPLHDGIPYTSGGHSAPDSLDALLGPGQIAPQFDRHGRLSQATRGIEEIYKGKVEYLGYTLSAMLFYTHNPDILTEILPLVQKADIYFTWMSKTPDRTVVPPASEMSLPTILTGKRSEQHAAMRRYRIGVEASIEGLKTADGKADLADNLLNAGMSFRETMEMVALRAIIAQPLHYDALAVQEGHLVSNVHELITSEVELFDGVRKRRRGANDIVDEVMKKMNKEKVKPTHMIIPPGMRSQIQSSDAKRNYYENGPGSKSIVDLGGASIGDMFGPGLKIIVAQGLYLTKSGTEITPLDREVTIGNYFVLRDRELGVSAKEYTSESRTVFPYDMDVPTGDYTRVGLDVGINNCGRWNDDGSLKEEHTLLADDAAKIVKNQGFALKNGYIDPFLFRREDNSYAVGQVLGQLEQASIPDKIMRATGDTLYERLLESLDDGDVRALRDGSNLIETLYTRPLNDIDLKFIEAVVTAAEFDESTGVTTANRFGGLDLPLALPAADGNLPADFVYIPQGYYPAGYGNSPGLLTLADAVNRNDGNVYLARIADDVKQKSVAYARAADHLWTAVRSLAAGNHVMLDGSSLPVWLQAAGAETDSAAAKRDSLTMLLSNLVDSVKMPLYVQVNKGGLAPLEDLTADQLNAKLGNDAKIGEVEVLLLVRNAISNSAVGELRKIFATADSISEFRDEYRASEFARAYASSVGGSEDEQDFGTFLLSELRAYAVVAAGGGRSQSALDRLISVVTRVVRVVRGEEPVPTGDIRVTIEAWADAAPPSGNRNFEVNAISIDGLDQLTQLTAPWQNVRNFVTINVASPADPSKYLGDNVTQADLDQLRRDSRIDLLGTTIFREPAAAAGIQNRRRAYEKLDENYGAIATVGAAQRQLFTSVAQREVRSRAGQRRQGVLSLNTNLYTRYAKVGREERDILRRLAHQMVLLAPLHRDTLLKWSEKNVRVPFDFQGFRPLCRYTTESMVFVKGGLDYGFVAFREIDVQTSHDAISRRYVFNITGHFAPVIMHPEYAHIQRDVRVKKYGGGAGLEPFSPETWDVENPNPELSVIYVLCGAQSTARSGAAKDAVDITGAFQRELYLNRMHATVIDSLNSQPLYDSAVYYNMIYEFNRLQFLRGADRFKFSVSRRVDNTFMLPVGQYNYKSSTKDFSHFDLNKDHFGPNVGPGHGSLRRTGLSAYYTDYNYEQRFVPS